MEQIPKPWIPIPETQAALGGLSRSAIYDLVDRNELERVKVGRRSFITVASIVAYTERVEAAAK